jgi:hypothetical protein
VGMHGATRILAALALALCPYAANAVDASDYLLLPTVVQGEREVDWRTGFGSQGPTTAARNDYSLGFGYGVTGHWFTELAAHYEQQDASLALRDFAWENILQLAEPGQWPVDVGVAIEAERSNQSSDQWEITAGPLLQREFGRYQANFNVLFGHIIENTGTATVRVHFQWQLKYRYSEPCEFGIQGFDYVSTSHSTWAPYQQQVHRVGPVALGRFKFQHERSLSYNVALLFGATDHSPDQTLRFQLEYEF